MTYIDSRGWVWEKQPDRESWKLDNIDGVKCYGFGLHLWVGFNWFRDNRWHVGTGGSPRVSKKDTLFDTAEGAMEAALPYAIVLVEHQVQRAEAELERHKKYERLIHGLKA
jgi:hypothetical protein